MATARTVEKLAPHGRRIVAIRATGPGRRIVTVGSLALTIHHRGTITLTIKLKSLGRQLLHRFGNLPLKLIVTAAGKRHKARTLATITLTIYGVTRAGTHIMRGRDRCRPRRATFAPLTT